MIRCWFEPRAFCIQKLTGSCNDGQSHRDFLKRFNRLDDWVEQFDPLRRRKARQSTLSVGAARLAENLRNKMR